jgi:hypothetical protein
MEIEISDELIKKIKLADIAVLAVITPVFLIDMIYLSGDVVHDNILILNETPVAIEITETGLPYSLELMSYDTRVRVRLTDPDGRVVLSETALIERSYNLYYFTPTIASTYHFEVTYLQLLSVDSLFLSVVKNDRRILSKIMYALP